MLEVTTTNYFFHVKVVCWVTTPRISRINRNYVKSREKIEDIEIYNRFTVLENYEICNSDYDLDTKVFL